MIGILSCIAGSPVVADEPLRVLFIGNSFTIEHNLPELFAGIVRQAGTEVDVDMIAEGGAHLADHFEAMPPYRMYQQYNPDVIILQDFSTAALHPEHAAKSTRALMSFCRNLRVRKVLFETWPREEGHQLYRQPGMPRTPSEMKDIVTRHYSSSDCPSMLEKHMTRHARVGLAWILGTGLPLYHPDKYHASLTGAWLSALVIARTLGLAPKRPIAPEGVRVTGRLVQIARMVAP